MTNRHPREGEAPPNPFLGEIKIKIKIKTRYSFGGRSRRMAIDPNAGVAKMGGGWLKPRYGQTLGLVAGPNRCDPRVAAGNA
jgi:hypothetical protein